MGDHAPGDVESFVRRSTYRRRVLERLGRVGTATPTEIADAVDLRRPHVSRALSQLREAGVVELRVSEDTTVGRYYGLTETGEDVLRLLDGDGRGVEWRVEAAGDPTARAVVSLAESEFGDDLRTVGRYDGDLFRFAYIDTDVRERYTPERIEDGLVALLTEHSLERVSFPDEECLSEVTQFDDFSALRVDAGDDVVLVTYDNECDVCFPSFADRVADAVDA